MFYTCFYHLEFSIFLWEVCLHCSVPFLKYTCWLSPVCPYSVLYVFPHFVSLIVCGLLSDLSFDILIFSVTGSLDFAHMDKMSDWSNRPNLAGISSSFHMIAGTDSVSKMMCSVWNSSVTNEVQNLINTSCTIPLSELFRICPYSWYSLRYSVAIYT